MEREKTWEPEQELPDLTYLQPFQRLAVRVLAQAFADALAPPRRNPYGRLYEFHRTRAGKAFFEHRWQRAWDLWDWCEVLSLDPFIVLDFYRRFPREAISTRVAVFLFVKYITRNIGGSYDN